MIQVPDPDDDPDFYADLVDEEVRARRAAQDAEWARTAVAALAELPRSQALGYLRALRAEAGGSRASALARVIEAACDHQIQRLAPRRPST